GGAVAYTGYTATAFGSPVNQAFYEIVFSGKVPQISRAMCEAKKKLLGDRWMNEYLNTLGEPEMWVWTSKPKTLTVKGEATAGRPVRLEILSGESPVEGARVCLVQRGTYLTSMSDEKGRVGFTGLEGTGKAQIFVLAQNHIPHESRLTVSRSEDPVLKSPKWIVDDDKEGESRGNGNGDLSPDETVELKLKWPLQPGKGELTLEIEDPYVEVRRGRIDAAKADGSFLLGIAGSVRPGHRVWATLKLTVKGLEGAWNWRESFPVQGPSLICVRASMEDKLGNKDGRLGWEDAGAEVALKVTVFNRGNQAAQDTVLTLACTDPAVKLAASEVKLGTVKAEDSAETRTPFGLVLDEKYDGHGVDFLLTMKDKNGGAWMASIRIVVPPAPPILLNHTAGTSYVMLSWRPGGTPGVMGYNVYRATKSGGTYKRLTEQPIRGMTVFRDNSVKPNGNYHYVVTSVTAEGLESEFSREHPSRTLSALWGRKR
ncbi:MAG: fibronectin type III domain-containing protein, partial [Planctomycetota bacterium]